MAISLNEKRVYRTFCNPKREMNSIQSFNNVSMKYRYEQMKITALTRKLAGTNDINKRKKELGQHLGPSLDKDLQKGQEMLREIKQKRVIEKDEKFEFKVKQKKKDKDIEQIKIASVMFNKYMDDMTHNKNKNATLNYFRTFDYDSIDYFLQDVNNVFQQTNLINKKKPTTKQDYGIDESIIDKDKLHKSKSFKIKIPQKIKIKKNFKRFIGSNDFSLRKRPLNYTLNQFPIFRLSKIDFNKHTNQEEIDNPPIQFYLNKENQAKDTANIENIKENKNVNKLMPRNTKIIESMKSCLSQRNLHSRNPITNFYSTINFNINNMNNTSNKRLEKFNNQSINLKSNNNYLRTISKSFQSCSDWQFHQKSMINKTGSHSRNYFVPFINTLTNQISKNDYQYLSIDKIQSINNFCKILQEKRTNDQFINSLKKDKNDDLYLKIKIASSKVAFMQSNLRKMIDEHGQVFCDNVNKLTQPQIDL